MKDLLYLTLLPALVLASTALAADPLWRTLNRDARLAIDSKDYPKLRATLLQLGPLLPGNPRIAYNLAAAEALLGSRDAALSRLHEWSAMGLIQDIAADADFASLRGLPDFQQITARVAEARKPVAGATLVTRLPAPDILPEDIAYDPKTHRFFVSSVRQGKIFTTDGREFARTGWGAMALRADPRRRILWATAGWLAQCAACPAAEAEKDKSALLAFDLDTGALKQRIESPLPGLLGDMTLGRSGDVYVSEGLHGAVLHLKPGAAQLERLDTEGEFPSPQTPALSADERTLYVPDYVRGIAAIDLDTLTVQWLQPAPGIALSGIDGLYVSDGHFLAVQNGTTPQRVISFSMDLRRQQVLEASTPGLGEPTHGVLVDGEFYFLANSGWGEYDAKGARKPGPPVQSEVRKIEVRKIKLPR
jgi:hypothetical protein